MVTTEPGFFLMGNKYNYPLNSANDLGMSSKYGLITKREDYTISFLFYYINKCSNNYRISCPILFTSYRAITLSKLIELHRAVMIQISPEHALYIGIELMKAELSLIIDHDYIQN
uniref:DUF4346 domain-containing protein n=1 Tax=Acrochaetium secundatum TaxID=209631 RepID=A0A4D6BKF7_9FLOR|nr:hypothetical protein [Acrochaetium secundatum]QBX88494.1 hypothetical protein [Acrochaetium secundatum]